MKNIEIKIDATKQGKVLEHFWSKCVGAGRANEGLRADWQKQLKMAVKQCGFEYIRFHGLLCDDMFVYRVENGIEKYNWQYIDSLFDTLLEIGIKPFVEFGFMPCEMASGEDTQFWWKGNVTPPIDYDKWGKLLSNAVKHWISRYGMEEVITWYYEIWNEADLHGFWNGTKSEYFKLYQVSVKAIKEIDERLKVGGPATSNFVPDERFDGDVEDVTKHITHKINDLDSLEWKGVWIEDFLNYCEENHLPVDFVSTHPYPTDFALDGQQEMKGRSRSAGSTRDDLTWLKDIVKGSAYQNAEIHLTEWSSSPTSRDYSHDYLPAANYIIKTNLDCTGLTDSLSYWVFTDIFEEAGAGPESFHGGFGMITMQGVKKPSFHAYRLLHTLGKEEIARGEEYIVTKTTEGKVSALIYNYADDLKQAVPISTYPDHDTAEKIQEMGQEKSINLVITGLNPRAEIEIEILDINNGNATKKLREFANNTILNKCSADNNGILKINEKLTTWGIMSIREK